MNKYNAWFGRGFIGKNPKYGVTKDGLQYLQFTLMTQNEGRTKAKQKTFSWHKCIIWGKLAEAVQGYCLEKTRANVVGSYCTNKYQSNGVWKHEMQVKVDAIDFLGAELTDQALDAAEVGKKAEANYDSDLPV